ncbi:hypothetical protein EAH76_02115 [Sphingomonas glacialis]|uniref:Transposase TnpC homeodomain domain-containing protein n=1 Tax=Sphingomonas glacialis TaxID=658225 RepID=A0A502G3J5_9SPHN|nr:hypothetical protein EAH76_02115 [Sphingomonas glacialis]
MSLDAASLSDHIGLPKAMVAAACVDLKPLRMPVAQLRRVAFGRSSERLAREADQWAFELEGAEAERPPRLHRPSPRVR